MLLVTRFPGRGALDDASDVPFCVRFEKKSHNQQRRACVAIKTAKGDSTLDLKAAITRLRQYE
jgi:hypothetical protein